MEADCETLSALMKVKLMIHAPLIGRPSGTLKEESGAGSHWNRANRRSFPASRRVDANYLLSLANPSLFLAKNKSAFAFAKAPVRLLIA